MVKSVMDRPEKHVSNSLEEVRFSVNELERARPGVNDPELNLQISGFLTAAQTIVARQIVQIGTTIADDMTSLLEGVRSLDVPAVADADMGRTSGLSAVRSAQGLVVLSLIRVIESAAKMGFEPRRNVVGALPAKADDPTLSAALKGVARRVEELEHSLDDLEAAQNTDRTFVQQFDLTSEVVGTLRGEAKLVLFLLNGVDPHATISAIIRTLAAMAERTGNFLATVVAWENRVSTAVFTSSERLRSRMRRALRGARTAINWHNRQVVRALSETGPKSPPGFVDQPPDDPPPAPQSVLVPYVPSLRRYGRQLLGSQLAADDCLKQVMDDVSQNPALLNYADSLRWQVFKLFSQNAARISERAYALEMDDSDTERFTRLARALDYPSREVFLLLGSEGFSRTEVSQILGTTLEHVRSVLAEAARHLAPELATHVLLIEPDTKTAERVAAIAFEGGHTVEQVTTAAEARIAARHRKPGLIIAEIQLSDGTSGLTAVNDILEQQPVPVIFVTAYPERFLTGPRPEPAFLISKPFDDAMLSAVMVQVLFFKRVATSGNLKDKPRVF
jgi:CheY-like chemotaxis protein